MGGALENSNQQFSVSVSPNPIHNRFKINSDVALKEWRIHSVSGKLILSGKGNDTEIDCQGWTSGIYVFRWESKNHETGVGKLIKK
ncbi:MAG: T9SS type A sorting domain-containing protein [Bacteroidales bacterium]|nr:T9SS type A sorting domain-containing protein [Bacteroidales bacterium]